MAVTRSYLWGQSTKKYSEGLCFLFFLTRFAVLLQRVSSPKFLQFGLGWFFVAQRSTTTNTQVQWYIQVRVQA